jgi:lipopolysaccharide transport system ATP-binding protein
MEIISIENVSKRYYLSHDKGFYGDSFRDAMTKRFQRFVKGQSAAPKGEEFWALKDVSFNIKQGDRVGIVGRNGAGKSTLLKILSRITPPTSGKITMRGRLASLLEVGTGFHPELTGRENIFLNGAILGMTKKEIQSKFDEIVAFSEIEKFLDTPVKRYSSGMYVRLAFAVAAHLEPEILIVDEVLAVGDIAFQKKCLGKMEDVSRGGRTVLFVSHNMGAIQQLCNTGVYLEKGKVTLQGDINDVVAKYMSYGSQSTSDGTFEREDFDKKKSLYIKAEIINSAGNISNEIKYGEAFKVLLYLNKDISSKYGIEFRIKGSNMIPVVYGSSWINSVDGFEGYKNVSVIEIDVPKNLNLVDDKYYIDFISRIPNHSHVDNWWDSVYFDVIGSRPGNSPISIKSTDDLGVVVNENVSFKIVK